jgi:hypothetical protein
MTSVVEALRRPGARRARSSIAKGRGSSVTHPRDIRSQSAIVEINPRPLSSVFVDRRDFPSEARAERSDAFRRFSTTARHRSSVRHRPSRETPSRRAFSRKAMVGLLLALAAGPAHFRALTKGTMMQRNSKARYWHVSIALALFGAIAGCSGASIDENGNAVAESQEISESAASLNVANGSSDTSSVVQTPSVRKCGPYQVCCEPLPNGACNLCRSDYRYCP